MTDAKPLASGHNDTIGDVRISWHRAGAGDERPAELNDFRTALAAGAELIEFDLRKLSDGEIAVFHDPATHDGTLLSTIGLQELREKTGSNIPTFHEVLAELSGKCIAHIDLKEEGYEDEVIERATTAMGEQFVITSLEDNSIATIKTHSPRIRVGLSLGRDMKGTGFGNHVATRLSELFPRKRVTLAQPDFLTVNHKLARISLLRYSARHHIPLWIWTVDDTKTQEFFLKRPEVEVLITNQPRAAAGIRQRLQSS